MREEDRNYVLSSWLRSYAESREFRHVPRPVYFRLYEPAVKAMLERSTVVIATMPESADVVLGWLATEGEVLHYMLVKPRWRRLGIAGHLLEGMSGLALEFTHEFPTFMHVPPSWRYDPAKRFEMKEAA
jgi:GNAT superfamily N-acetyltransferase